MHTSTTIRLPSTTGARNWYIYCLKNNLLGQDTWDILLCHTNKTHGRRARSRAHQRLLPECLCTETGSLRFGGKSWRIASCAPKRCISIAVDPAISLSHFSRPFPRIWWEAQSFGQNESTLSGKIRLLEGLMKSKKVSVPRLENSVNFAFFWKVWAYKTWN